MSLISLDLNQAHQIANAFQSSGQSMHELRAQLQSQWTRLAATWEGHSHDLVEPEIQALLNRCGQVAESVRERGAKLAQIADRFQAADENEPLVVLPLPWGKPDWPSPHHPGGDHPQPPEFPTLPIGEEEQHRPDTTTLAVGEEGQQPPEFTLAGTGEEGLPPSHIPRDPMTMLAVGEDGRQPPDFTTLAVGEEGQRPPFPPAKEIGIIFGPEHGQEPPRFPKESFAIEHGQEPPSSPGKERGYIFRPEHGQEPPFFPSKEQESFIVEHGHEPPFFPEKRTLVPEHGFEPPTIPKTIEQEMFDHPEDGISIIAEDGIEPPKSA